MSASSSVFNPAFVSLLLTTWAARADIVPLSDPNFDFGSFAPAQSPMGTAEGIFPERNGEQSQLIRTRMEAASAAYVAGNALQAEKLLRDATQEFPQEPSIYVSLARFYYAQRRFHDADGALQAALKLKESARLYLDLGTLYAEGLNRPVEAVDYFYKAISRDPNVPGAHYALGQLLSKMDQPEQARKEFSEAARLDPKNALSGLGLARIEVHARQPARAFDAYKKAIALAPNNGGLLVEVADLHAALNQTNEALKNYTLATQKSPTDAGVWTKLGMFYQTQGNLPDADQAYETALKIQPRLAVALNNRAAMALDVGGDLKEPLVWARQAVDLSPQNPYFLDTLGVILHRAGKLAEAKSVLDRVVRSEIEYPSAQYHLALVNQQLGQSKEAKRLLQEALASKTAFPERKSAEQALAKLSTDGAGS